MKKLGIIAAMEVESKLIARKNYYDKEMAKPERQEQLQIIKNNFFVC